jgi:flagella basal body P-ring formation protein FlgA
MFKLLLIIALFFGSVFPCSALQITFKQDALVERMNVTLGDIAQFDENTEMTQALGSQRVAQAPPPGKTVSLNSLAIKKQLVTTLSLPGSIHWTGSPTVILKRSGIHIGSTKIKEIIAEYLRRNAENLPDADMRFIPAALPLPFILPVGILTYEVIPSNPRILGSSRFSIIFRVNDRVAKNMSVRGKIEALAPVVVATVRLKKGAVLSPDNLTLALKDLNQLSNPGFNINNFSGKIMRQNIRAGTPISRSMVTSLPVVKRGERVKIIISSGQMHLSASGIARADGRHNQMIRVQNIHSKKIIHCRVAAPGLVEVIL